MRRRRKKSGWAKKKGGAYGELVDTEGRISKHAAWKKRSHQYGKGTCVLNWSSK